MDGLQGKIPSINGWCRDTAICGNPHIQAVVWVKSILHSNWDAQPSFFRISGNTGYILEIHQRIHVRWWSKSPISRLYHRSTWWFWSTLFTLELALNQAYVSPIIVFATNNNYYYTIIVILIVMIFINYYCYILLLLFLLLWLLCIIIVTYSECCIFLPCPDGFVHTYFCEGDPTVAGAWSEDGSSCKSFVSSFNSFGHFQQPSTSRIPYGQTSPWGCSE